MTDEVYVMVVSYVCSVENEIRMLAMTVSSH